MPRYRIFPAIGFARLGEDGNFFVGPEIPGSGPGELRPDGTLGPVTQFKDVTRTRIRKQGARFHVFESNDGVTWGPANLPALATVTWTVTLENKKAGIKRDAGPPISPTRPEIAAELQSMIIKGGTRQIGGSSATSAPFSGLFATTAADGTPFNANVELGKLVTDAGGRLIVLGGKGFAGAPPNTPIGGIDHTTYYKNPKWHDDVSDGPVSAEIRLTSTSQPVQAEGGAWVVVAPPDYAPGIMGVVTLYDVILQLGIDHFGLAQPGTPSFDLDIAPLLSRVRRLQWVHEDATWSSPIFDNPKLRSRAAADKAVRESARNAIEHVEDVLKGHVDPQGPSFRLRKFQREMLDLWVSGTFNDAPGQPDTTFTAPG
ncbi:MAG: LodA/GoxA family CTQ-dependent oxidase, partial [bacterium]